MGLALEPETDFIDGVEKIVLNFFGAHPGALVVVGLLIFSVLTYFTIINPAQQAYIRGRWPDPATRPPEAAGRLAALRAVERFYRWLLGALPFVKHVPPLDDDK